MAKGVVGTLFRNAGRFGECAVAGERCAASATGGNPTIRQAGHAAATVLALLAGSLTVPAVAETLASHDTRHRLMPDYDPLGTDAGTTLDQGRGALFATLANLVGRLYDGAKAKLGLDAPVPLPEAAQPAARSLQTLTLGTLELERLTFRADPRGYLSQGIAADSTLSILGLDSLVGVRVGTESLNQSFSLKGDCSSLWMPNDVSSSFSAGRDDHGIGAWSGYLRTSWGTACTQGQAGWRITAGMEDFGTETVNSLGLEYRPARFTFLAKSGLSSLRANMVGEAGQVGAELTMWEMHGQPVRLNAGFDWQESGDHALRLGTSMRF